MENAPPIYIIAERRKGCITPETCELVTFARRVGRGRNPTILLPGKEVTELSHELAQELSCDVIALEGAHLDPYNALSHAGAVLKILHEDSPSWVCLPHTSMGYDLAPRLAVLLRAACITAVETAEEGGLGRPIYSGRFREVVTPLTNSVVVTVLPGAFQPSVETAGGPGRVRIVEVEAEEFSSKTIGVAEPLHRDSSLQDAEIIVSGGRGLGSKDHVDLLKQLAAVLPRSAVGASRAACDLGWLEHRCQIGVTGQTVSPKLYLACGISGAFQHVSAIRNSQTIVAVNTDPRAAIFQVAHYGIVEDLTTFLPILIAELKRGASPAPKTV